MRIFIDVIANCRDDLLKEWIMAIDRASPSPLGGLYVGDRPGGK
jgi:hypothetical protein